MKQDPRSRQYWWWAILAAVLWHLAALGILGWWAPWDNLNSEVETFEPIQMVFAPSPIDGESPPRDEPREFTELPEERADLAPTDPDYISNVDSRARDRAVDEETTDVPRLEGESPAPHVGLSPDVENPPPPTPEGSGDPESTTPTGEPQPEEGAVADATDERGTQLRPADTRSPVDGRRGRPGETRDRAGAPTPVPPLEHQVGPTLSDMRQEEMRNPMGNVPLFGDVSMNTVAWPWAPWLQQFQRNFLRGWSNFVPYAYRIGVIHGKQVVQLEIAKDGTLLSIDVLEREGHGSLEEASLANLRSFAPYGPLSADGSFPEPTLRLQVTILYPDF